MSLSALRRTAAGAAVLATAAAGVVAVPALHASADTGVASTSLSIRAVHGAVRPGGSDTIAGSLAVAGSGSAAGRTVTLEAKPMGTDDFVPVGDTTARTHGGVRESVTPDVTTRYRWHYAGDTDARQSYSGVVSVRVRTPHHPATGSTPRCRSAPCTTSWASTVRTSSGAGCSPGTSRSATGP